MPGNEIEDKIRILYELDNFSLGQHRSQAVDDSRPVLIYNQWVEKQRQGFNLKSSTVQQFGKRKFTCGHHQFFFFKELTVFSEKRKRGECLILSFLEVHGCF